jgi:hypothetical protein
MKNTCVSKLNWAESISIGLVATALFGLLFGYYRSMMPYTYGDTAFLIEVVSNLANDLKPVSKLLAQNWAGIGLSGGELAVYCQRDLVAGMFTTDPYNWLSSLHAYVILYLITPFAQVLGPLNALSAFMALAFASIPGIAYFYLRKYGVSVAVSILVSAICMFHPAWQISSGGQFYADRFFIPFALLYVLHLHQYFQMDGKAEDGSRNYHLPLALLFGMLGGLTAERNMLTIAAFSVAYSLVARTSLKKRAAVIGFAILCFTYAFSYVHYLGGSADNARVMAGLFQWQSLFYAANVPGIGEYLWFNLALLALPAVFAPRIFMAILPIVALNCLITMGGAEKNGWLTHYHSHYFGFLLAAFLIAIANTKGNFGETLNAAIHRFRTPVVAAIAISVFVSVSHLYKGQSVFNSLWDYYGRAKELSATRAQKEVFDNLAQMVPEGAAVTSTEWGMPAWYLRGNKVNLFPLGVGQNDYVMVQAEGEIPNVKLLSAMRYRGDAVQANGCIAPVISANYIELARQGTWVLYKKNMQPANAVDKRLKL